jgi:hypothetical protein
MRSAPPAPTFKQTLLNWFLWSGAIAVLLIGVIGFVAGG